jgi:hypothetical protein
MNCEKFSTSLIFDEDGSIEEADGEDLTVWRPVTNAAL